MATSEPTTETVPRLVFAAYSHTPINRPQPPGLTNTDKPDSYFGYFVNEHGEKWLFEFDKVTHEARLFGGDCNWKSYPLVEGSVPGVVLNANERTWLSACWAATEFYRRRAEAK